MSGTDIDWQGLGVAEALREIAALLAGNGLENAEADARMLLLGATGLSRSDLILAPERRLDPSTTTHLEGLILRRLAGEPATRVLGERLFWTLRLRVTPDVLDPRPDSEAIVLAALDALGERKNTALRILDLGTGTGALLLALLSECPLATGVGVDLSPEACAVACDNAARNGLADRAVIRQGRWTDGLTESFDVVVSNPPYIESAAIPALSVEVRRYDPMLALDGGADGLMAYREIMRALPSVMRPDAIAILELGAGQLRDVAFLAHEASFSVTDARLDLGGVQRALVLRLKNQR